jgi:hypothetical protein
VNLQVAGEQAALAVAMASGMRNKAVADLVEVCVQARGYENSAEGWRGRGCGYTRAEGEVKRRTRLTMLAG